MYYATYEDAVRAHYTDKTKVDIHMIEHPDSYNKVLYNDKVVEWVGIGRMKSPGHPSANQLIQRQDEFIGLYREQGSIPIFYTFPEGNVKFLGNYTLKSLKKKLSFEGFQYYEYKFTKITINKYF
jgi:hypothetical protein